MPGGQLPSGSRFGIRAASGITNTRPVWVEERPLGPLLSDLDTPLDDRLADYIILQLCHALELLHLNGQTHGDLSADRVGLEAQGRAVLLGSGRRSGSEDADFEALFTLHLQLGGQQIPEASRSLDGMIRCLGESPPPEQAQLAWLNRATLPIPEAASLLEVLLSTTVSASIDEVGIDLGPDEEGKGILDEWTGGGTDEGERTGTLSAEAVAEQRRLALLSRLGRDPGDLRVPDHIRALDGPPLGSIAELLGIENLDPLPSPGSMDAPRIPAPGDTSAGEVTRARIGPLLPASDQDDVTAAQLDQIESFQATAEVTRIRPRPLAAPDTKKRSPLLWLTALGWILAIVALYFVWKGGGMSG
jgi:hypothetical protein